VFCAADEDLRDFTVVDLNALDRSLLGQRPVRSPVAISSIVLTDRLNAPVQGTAADGLKLALALLRERRAECPGAVPVLVCHDEVFVECAAEQAADAKAWLEKAMVDGMDAVLNSTDEVYVPAQVEGRIARSWREGS
jgi:DNA polymerase family A